MKFIINCFLILGFSLFTSHVHADLTRTSGDGAQNSATKNIDPSARFGTLLSDFNNDGILDFVAADQPGYLSIRLGIGDGNFAAAKFTPLAGTVAHSLALCDLNGDGKFDIVAAGGGKLSILFGRGNGTFTLKRAISTAFDQSVNTFDINRDARNDLITSGSTGIAVRLGNGNGTFTAEKYYVTESGAATNVTVADIDYDGMYDIVATGASAIGRVFMGEGNGTFQNGQPFSLGLQKVSAQTVADVNKDNALDLVLVGSGGLMVLTGQGNGSFNSPLWSLSSTTSALALADLNVDGILDSISSAYNGLSVGVGTIFGTFVGPLAPDLAQGSSSTVLNTADVNGDGKIDVLVSGYNSSGVGVTSVRFGQGNGTFHPSKSVNFVNGVGAEARLPTFRIR